MLSGSHFKRKGDDAEAFKFFQLAADQVCTD
jgi:hypothetical protein